MGWSEDAATNRALWTKSNAAHTDATASSWQAEPRRGLWRIPEAELGVLGDVAGQDVVELGCSTAYLSAWLARAGARPVAVDVTPTQLETARRCMYATGIEFPLVEADAGATGLPAASADLVVSGYGALRWVDPYRWVREAARLLRPGGRLIFACASPFVLLCSPEGEAPVGTELVRAQAGPHRLVWPDGAVEFSLPHRERIELLRASGFELERLVELCAPPAAETHEYYDYVSVDWARRWPAEEIWGARRR